MISRRIKRSFCFALSLIILISIICTPALAQEIGEQVGYLRIFNTNLTNYDEQNSNLGYITGASQQEDIDS
jgi:predicted PurR-regulated permease PerM